MVTLWFPVNRPVGPDCGTISVIPASHKEGRRPADTYLRGGYFRQIEAKPSEREAADEQALGLQLGDCCVMDGNLLHRSVANRSATPRVAAVARLVHLAKLHSYDRERFYCVHKA